MHKVIMSIVDEIDEKLTCVKMDISESKETSPENSWRKDIPSGVGWYFIKTNTPLEVLATVREPEYKAHTNIPGTIVHTSAVRDIGIAIKQSGHKDYVVYNGKARNLKSRAMEHQRGDKRTYCLCLKEYKALYTYNWTFCFVPISCFSTLKEVLSGELLQEEKLLRHAAEQAWRVKHGWPVLCRR